MNIVAIVPAREASKRLKNKNRLILHGKPLIEYTLDEAIKSKYIDTIIVSSDDNVIKSITNRYRNTTSSQRIIFDRRPKSLRGDDILIQDVIDDIRKRYKFNITVLLQPTSPLRKVKYIDECIDVFLNHSFDSVVTIKEIAPYTYYPNGAVYVFKDTFAISMWKDMNYKNIGFILMSRNESIDIDSQIDFETAKAIMRKDV